MSTDPFETEIAETTDLGDIERTEEGTLLASGHTLGVCDCGTIHLGFCDSNGLVFAVARLEPCDAAEMVNDIREALFTAAGKGASQ
jgi:hypothetical protein